MCRKVQVERPSSSTSGGQSVWVEGGGAGVVVVVVAARPAPAAMPPDVEACLSIARQEAADVHVLHLSVYVSLIPLLTDGGRVVNHVRLAIFVQNYSWG